MADRKSADVLVWRDKHGDRLYDASTPERLYAASLHILEQRVKIQYIMEPDPLPEPEISEEEYNEIIKDENIIPAVKQYAEDTWRLYRRRARVYAEDKKAWVDTQTALANKDGKLAWRILQDRDDYEYENVSIEAMDVFE